jgi:hypothetical protein
MPVEHHEYAEETTIGGPFLGTKEKGKKSFEKAGQNWADFIEEARKIKVEIKSRDDEFRVW